ncbi:VCBS repeat-containing protein [Nannocystis sp. ILAH1]|uniref:FG-GAP repeat domain-containing protein n=1 Tax=Nannocystis sp. ILAH1 TaxID=2996789 RepID=UPI00226FA43F|nr:VCBS repeat-containing protein [Nannocystis sp. ILAH1]
MAGLCWTACGPDTQGETEGSSGTTSGGSSSSGAPTDGMIPPSEDLPNDSSDYVDCKCPVAGDTQECQVDGQAGAQICEGEPQPEICGLDWSECHVCAPGEPWPCNFVPCGGADGECGDSQECSEEGFCRPLPAIPTCERQAFVVSEFELLGRAAQVELVDLDGDGALDLVVLLAEDSLVEVALGDGAGGFLPGMIHPTGLEMSHQSLAIADFDSDGSFDLAIGRWWEPGAMSLLFGQAGSFAEPVVTPTIHPPMDLRAGDFDGDGDADLVALGGSYEAEIVLYRGDGMGGFVVEPHDVPGDEFFFAAVGAVAGEPRLDVVVTRASPLRAEVLEYEPETGVFATVATMPGVGVTPYDGVAIGDIDGDAALDVVAHREVVGGGQIQTWPQLMPGTDLPVQRPIRLERIADVDGDGRGDLLVNSWHALAVHVVYVDAPCVQSNVGGYASSLAAGDLDGDGKADIVDAVGNTVQILLTGS